MNEIRDESLWIFQRISDGCLADTIARHPGDGTGAGGAYVDGITRLSERADRRERGSLLSIRDDNGQCHGHIPANDCLVQHGLIVAKIAALHLLDDVRL